MTYSQFLKSRVIRTGCEWRLKIKITSSALAAFPAGARFKAQIRKHVNDPIPLVTLTTANGNITRVDGNTIEIALPASATKDWEAGKVVMDIIRTDLTQVVHLGFDLEIPVKRTITRDE